MEVSSLLQREAQKAQSVVAVSECGHHATVTWPPGEEEKYCVQHYLRDHGCCSCATSTQGFMCKHHIAALLARYAELGMDAVCNSAMHLAGAVFGTQEGCHLGEKGLTPLVQLLDTKRQALQPGPSIVTIQADSQAKVANTTAENLPASEINCARETLVDSSAHDAQKSKGQFEYDHVSPVCPSPSKKALPDVVNDLRQLAAVLESAPSPVRRAVVPKSKQVLHELKALVDRSGDMAIRMQAAALASAQLTAAREVNPNVHKEKRHRSVLEQASQLKRVSMEEHSSLTGKDDRSPILCVRSEKKKPKTIGERVEDKVRKANRR